VNKKIKLTLQDFFDIKGTQIFNPDFFPAIDNFSIDSRQIKKGSLFIAIRGQRFDGHNFVKDSIDAGASVVAIEKKYLKEFKHLSIPFIVVNDTTKFLGHLASVWRSKLRTKIIGIGGSNGKTTTKEILATLLSYNYSVNKTEANKNNHIGVPLTILSTNNHHKYLVLEFGSNHPGEIKYLVQIAKPDYALITNIGDSHLEFFKDRVGVVKEEGELFKNTISNGGIIFLNYEDPILRRHYASIKNKITYSFNYKTNFVCKIKEIDEQHRISFIVNQNRIKFKSPLPGEMGLYNFFASIVVAKTFGMTFKDISIVQKNIKAYDKRLELKKFNTTWIINDCYNANPTSMELALDLLNNFHIKYKKIAILGDMLELGETSIQKHKEIGKYINTIEINSVFTFGNHSRYISKAVVGYQKEKHHFNSKEDLKKYLDNLDLSKTIILIKGSRGMQLEEITEFLEAKLK
jgi:UDP-N-acetylmuramoyl-tripeptide--D-alanyl-D-alanine ligase